MNNFKTELEKELWEMLYKSQTALSIMCLNEANRTRENNNDWPAGKQWNELAGSSHAVFNRTAREKAGIDHKKYLEILRSNDDALEIAEKIYKKYEKNT